MCHLGRFLGQGFVVEALCLVRVEAEIELILPAKLETRLGERVVADLGAGMALGEIGRVRGQFVSDDAFLDVVLVRQSKMFLGGDVAEHGRAVPTDQRSANAAGDVVVTRRDVGGQRPQRIEGRFLAVVELQVHVLLDQLHRHMPRSFDEDLAIVFPGNIGELAERFQLAKLGFVVGVVDRAGA